MAVMLRWAGTLDVLILAAGWGCWAASERVSRTGLALVLVELPEIPGPEIEPEKVLADPMVAVMLTPDSLSLEMSLSSSEMEDSDSVSTTLTPWT